MIRATFRDGQIHPLDPLPDGWSDGRVLRIEEAEPTDDPEELDRWYRELSASAASRDDLGDWEAFEAALQEADREAKGRTRREMGLG